MSRSRDHKRALLLAQRARLGVPGEVLEHHAGVAEREASPLLERTLSATEHHGRVTPTA